MEKHKTITFLDHCIHYRDEGREHSKTLVLLHGFLQSQDTWSPYILSYMRTMRVIAIDLPGHGYSDNFGDVNTMEMMADAVKAVLDELDIEQCVLVGHSLGGYVALAFADRYPYTYSQTSLSIVLDAPFDAMTDRAIRDALQNDPSAFEKARQQLSLGDRLEQSATSSR